MTVNISHFKTKLEEEKKSLEQELTSVGHINTSNPKDWEAIQTEDNDLPSDRTEVAEAITEYEANTAILKQLETELVETNAALDRIEKGVFGICEVCNKEIEDDRLEANPSARTCKTHVNEILS